MKWCCAIFEFLAEAPGERGISVIVATLVSDSFLLQGRAVDAGLAIGHTDVPVSTVSQQAIFHCPGCGVRLAKFYAKNLEVLRREDLRLG